MTLDEIGRALGMSKKAVSMCLYVALRKIRNRPVALAQLKEAVAFQQREHRGRVALWDQIEEALG